MTSDPKSVNTLLALTNDDAYVQVALLCCVIRGRRSMLQVFGLRPEMTSDPKSVNTLWALTIVDACVQVAWLFCVIRGRSIILQVFGLKTGSNPLMTP